MRESCVVGVLFDDQFTHLFVCTKHLQLDRLAKGLRLRSICVLRACVCVIKIDREEMISQPISLSCRFSILVLDEVCAFCPEAILISGMRLLVHWKKAIESLLEPKNAFCSRLDCPSRTLHGWAIHSPHERAGVVGLRLRSNFRFRSNYWEGKLWEASKVELAPWHWPFQPQ